ncbi:MAG: SpoIID/LytB domain-containing protein [Planctomycetaceae bacterium]|nr:SpoIID/LytB domain-containing protein [Planctomycetaceae bacterium]
MAAFDFKAFLASRGDWVRRALDRYRGLSPMQRIGRAVAVCLLTAGCLGLLVGAGSCSRKIRPDRDAIPPGKAPLLRVRISGRSAESAAVFTTGPYRLLCGDTVIGESSLAMPVTTVKREGNSWRVGQRLFLGPDLTLETFNRAHVGYASKAYRGALRLAPAGSNALMVINHIDVDNYLAGVLASELYTDWHIEAYKALAVAARTFALYHVVTGNSAQAFHIGADQSAQMYTGVAGETDKSRQAALDTRGLVLGFGPEGNERIFLAQYSACCGGRVNPVDVLRDGETIEPLRGGQFCSDCRASNYYRWPEVTVPKRQVYLALVDALGDKAKVLKNVSDIRVTQQTPWGRPIWVEAVGAGGQTLRLRTENLRYALMARKAYAPQVANIRSSNCTIRSRGDFIVFCDGQGFGHGVGLCQWGAQAKALQGWSAERILNFYYPGSKRIPVY